MNSLKTLLVALMISVIALFGAAPAQALPTPVVTYDAIQVQGTYHTYDASASVCNGGCTVQWRYYVTGGSSLGSTLGNGPVISAVIPRAPGDYRVVAKVIDRAKPYGWTAKTLYVRVVAP